MSFCSLSSLTLTLGVIAGVGAYQAHALKTADKELARLQNTATVLQRDLAVARTSRAIASDEAAAASRATVAANPLVSTGDAALDEQGRELLRRVYALRKRIDHDASEWIPEIRHACDRDWFAAVTSVSPWIDTDKNLSFAAASVRRSAQMTFLAAVQRAIDRYTEEHDGVLPKSASDLAPYFAGPCDEDALSRYDMVASGRLQDRPNDEPILEEKMSPADREYAEVATVNGLSVRLKEFEPTMGSASRAEWRRNRAIFSAMAAYQKNHDGNQPTDTQQLRPYIADPAMLDGVELEEDGFRISHSEQ